MLSVWFKSLDIYIGHGLAMLKAGSSDPVVLRTPATLPLDRVLSAFVDSAGKNVASGCNVRVYFSGAMCPALSIAAPKEVTRWQERRQIGHAVAAQSLGASTSEISCEMDGIHPGIAAAVFTASLEELQSWAKQQGGRIVSIEPIWAIATHCAAARHRSVQGLVLHEPDAITMLANDGHGRFDALSLSSQIDSALLATHSRRWLIGHGLTEDRALTIGFSAVAGNAMRDGPKPWSVHWYRP